MARQINLVNPLLQTQKTAFSAHNMAQALGLCLLGMLLLYAYSYFTVLRLQWQISAKEKSVYEETGRLQRATEEMQKRAQNPQLVADLREYEQKLAAQQSVLEVVNQDTLANIDHARPYSQYLGALARQWVSGLWLTEVRITGSSGNLSLKGRVTEAALLPDYMNRLKTEKVLSGNNFGVMELTEASLPTTANTRPPMDFVLRDAEVPK